MWSEVWGGAPHSENGIFGAHLGELRGLSRMDKGEAWEAEEEERRKIETHGYFQALVRNVDFIIIKES